MQSSPAIETEDKDLPLREDIRLLGRILGDTIREQGGEAGFDTGDTIVRAAIRQRLRAILTRFCDFVPVMVRRKRSIL
jgi:phosphoenolpyruvate carboxylase